mmetsp:Transcript_15384/g.39244  ORF Transcript_15384/g.39244 Transcript_15384/m.39244 type:complete len:189 (+) Transcript_15384:669-1235(+)
MIHPTGLHHHHHHLVLSNRFMSTTHTMCIIINNPISSWSSNRTRFKYNHHSICNSIHRHALSSPCPSTSIIHCNTMKRVHLRKCHSPRWPIYTTVPCTLQTIASPPPTTLLTSRRWSNNSSSSNSNSNSNLTSMPLRVEVEVARFHRPCINSTSSTSTLSTTFPTHRSVRPPTRLPCEWMRRLTYSHL